MLIQKTINRYKYKRIIKQPENKSVIVLIEKSIKLFPEIINFSDGEIRKKNGFFSDALSSAWHNAEEKNAEKDVNIDFMLWSIFGVLHKKCRQLYKQGVYSLNVYELDNTEIYRAYIMDCLESGIPVCTNS